MGDLEDMLKEMSGDPRVHMMLYVFAFLVFTWVYKILLKRPVRPGGAAPTELSEAPRAARGFHNDNYNYRPPVFDNSKVRGIWTPFDQRATRRNAGY